MRAEPHVVHDIWCIRARVIYPQLLAAFEAKWPHYCRACGGVGGKMWPGTYHNPPEFGECPACMGKCPLCGVELTDADYESGPPYTCGCPVDIEMAPTEPECLCYFYSVNSKL